MAALPHIEVINRILIAEKNARGIADEAHAELDRLPAALEKERDELREKYLARANRRIETVRTTEESYAEEMEKVMDDRLSAAIASSEDAARIHSDEWVSKMFDMVINAPFRD